MFEQPTATFDQRHRDFFNTHDEPRQVWALDSTTGQIVYLPEHAVSDSIREACRSGRLRCPDRAVSRPATDRQRRTKAPPPLRP